MLRITLGIVLAVGLFAPLPADEVGFSPSEAQDGPRVTRTLPPDKTRDVPRNTEIRVYFDRRMLLESFTDNFEIRLVGGGTVSWEGRLEGKGTVFVAKSAQLLFPDERDYLVTLTSGITGAGGNPLEDQNGDEPGAYTFTFRTGHQTDFQPPVLSQIKVTPNPTYGADELELTTSADDSGDAGGTPIGAGEFFVDNLAKDGDGIPLNPTDGSFNETSEWLRGTINSSDWPTGPIHVIYLHAMDAAGNWCFLQSVVVYTEGGDFFDEDDVYVWPNPATDRATFTFTVGGNSRVELVVYDLAGREVYREKGDFSTGSPGSFVWDLTGVASDVYIFYVYAEETTGQLRRASVVKKLAVVR